MAYLENDIIKLRALEPEDMDFLYRWENDSDLWRYGSTLAPYSRFSIREYLADSRLDIFQTRQLRLIVVSKDENQPIGTIDLYDFDPINSRAGIGILIDSQYRKRGFGIAALDLIKNYAFHFLMMKQLFAYVPEKNIPSVKLFKNCGYETTGHLRSWIKNGDTFEDVFFMQLIR